MKENQTVKQLKKEIRNAELINKAKEVKNVSIYLQCKIYEINVFY